MTFDHKKGQTNRRGNIVCSGLRDENKGLILALTLAPTVALVKSHRPKFPYLSAYSYVPKSLTLIVDTENFFRKRAK